MDTLTITPTLLTVADEEIAAALVAEQRAHQEVAAIQARVDTLHRALDATPQPRSGDDLAAHVAHERAQRDALAQARGELRHATRLYDELRTVRRQCEQHKTDLTTRQQRVTVQLDRLRRALPTLELARMQARTEAHRSIALADERLQEYHTGIAMAETELRAISGERGVPAAPGVGPTLAWYGAAPTHH